MNKDEELTQDARTFFSKRGINFCGWCIREVHNCICPGTIRYIDGKNGVEGFPSSSNVIYAKREHYNQGDIECIDAIRASMTLDEFKAYLRGNIFKYVWRFPFKDGVKDLKKAYVYLGWLIEVMETGGFKKHA